MTTQHVRPLLSAYIDNEATPAERREVETHLATCAECRAVLTEYRAIGGGIRALTRPVPPSNLHREVWAEIAARQNRPAWAPALAGLLRVGAVGTVLAALLVVAYIAWPKPGPQYGVAMTRPANGQTNVGVNARVVLHFDPAVVESTLDQVYVAASQPIDSNEIYTHWLTPGKDLELVPAQDAIDQQWHELTTYTITVKSPVLAASDGQTVVVAADNHFSFTTGPKSVLEPTDTPSPTATDTPLPSPTPVPPTEAVPTVVDTPVPPTEVVPTVEPPTQVVPPPATETVPTVQPPTQEPPTQAPPTALPPTSAPTREPSAIPATAVPPTQAPPPPTVTLVPPTVLPPTRPPVPSDTPVPPSVTVPPPLPTVEPTFTPLLPSPTVEPPTSTPVPPTFTPVPPTPTPQLPNVVTPVVPTVAPTQAPGPVPIKSTPSPEPVPPEPGSTPTLQADGCLNTPQRGFGKVFNEQAGLRRRLGCPSAPETALGAAAEQNFERGYMFWQGDTARIYVFSSAKNTWQSYPDRWTEGSPPDLVLTPPPTLIQPVRGFGQTWLDQPGVRDTLGWANGAEHTINAVWQPFDHGTMLWTESRMIRILYESGAWELYADTFTGP